METCLKRTGLGKNPIFKFLGIVINIKRTLPIIKKLKVPEWEVVKMTS